jgi:hypothetical protein
LHSPLSYGDSVAEFRFGVLPYPWDPRKVRRAPGITDKTRIIWQPFPESGIESGDFAEFVRFLQTSARNSP